MPLNALKSVKDVGNVSNVIDGKFSAYFTLLPFFTFLTFSALLSGCGGYGNAKKDQPVYRTPQAAVISERGKDGRPVDAARSISLSLTSPKEGELIDGPDVSVSFVLSNYELAANGNHVHLILDNEPYIPCYDTTKPYMFKNVAPGPHVIRAFPSRPWHESWKNPEAFSVVKFYVNEQIGEHSLDVTRPFLTYSRPKGEYAGEQAKKVLFDFWLSNCDLSETGYKVRYLLDGKPALLTKWEPVWWEGLVPGLHALVLELLDQDGNLVRNGWNRTERTFTIKSEASPTAPHH